MSKRLDAEERFYLSLILEEGSRVDVPGVCIEHRGLMRLKRRGLIHTRQPIKKGHLINWRLTKEGRKIARSIVGGRR